MPIPLRLALSVIVSITTFGACTTQEAANSQATPFRVELSSVNQSHNVTDVIPLRIRLKNQSGNPIRIAEILDPVENVSIELAGPGEQFRKALSFILGRCGEASPLIQLEPGEFLQTSALVSPGFKSIDKFALPAEGKWTFKATYKTKDLAIESDVLSLQLTASQGLPVQTRAFCASKEWHQAVLNDGTFTKESIRTALDLFSSGVAVPQKDILGLMIGRHCQRGWRVRKQIPKKDPTTGAVLSVHDVLTRERDYPRAIEAYSVASDSAASHIKARALVHLAECYLATGNIASASEVVSRITPTECDTEVRRGYNLLQLRLQRAGE